MSAHAGIKNGNPQVGGADRLTDLLTRRCGTGETVRDVGDSYRPDSLVSETGQNTGDGGDVRRSAHNPATTGGLVLFTDVQRHPRSTGAGPPAEVADHTDLV